ncbi:hypothetical protein F5B20DRAFT_407250 [Whalleya microplaca]|nr:hypothetical protein F5B20DRAFT_407250 [Whalleya microplaca]
MPKEMEAYMFAIQGMSIAAMRTTDVQKLLGHDRREMIRHYQQATELALFRADLLTTRHYWLFCALLYYLGFLFAIGQPEKATALLGIASRLGMRMGLHLDPSLHSFSPWQVEVRSRIWMYFLALDGPVFNCEGAESLFDTSWIPRARNANDSQWPAHRFIKADQIPPDAEGFTDMTYPLMRIEWMCLLREIRRMSKSSEPHKILSVISQFDAAMRRKFTNHMDKNDPMQVICLKWHNCYFDEIRLHSDFKSALSGGAPYENSDVLTRTVEMFEEIEKIEHLMLQHNWEWMIRWPPAFHSIARLLHGLYTIPDHPEADRAWKQVDLIFRRYNNENFSMDNVPAWRVIERLCDKAMLTYSNRIRELTIKSFSTCFTLA